MERQELSKAGAAIDKGLHHAVIGTEAGLKATAKGLGVAGRFIAGAAKAAKEGGVQAVRESSSE